MRYPLLLATLLVAGCVPKAAPPPRPAAAPPVATPRALPPPPVAVDWRDRPATPGTWSYRRDDRGSVALFGGGGVDALAVLRCDLVNRRLFLSRAGAAAGPITVRTTSIARQLQAGAAGGDPPYAAAVLAANDPLLDAMAFSRGRFALEQAGAPPLMLPAWAEIGRVVEDCR